MSKSVIKIMCDRARAPAKVFLMNPKNQLKLENRSKSCFKSNNDIYKLFFVAVIPDPRAA